MLASADRRSFPAREERYQHCVFCGKDLVVLPNDRRGGACFDCLILASAVVVPCPDCGTELAADALETNCPNCGWSPRIDSVFQLRFR